MTSRYQDTKIKDVLTEILATSLQEFLDQDYSSLIENVSSEFAPEEIFTFCQLEEWALGNGFVRKEK